jgi:hypothetical protein
MTPTRWHKVLVALAVVPALVGVIDAALDGQPDLLAVFVLVATALLALLAVLHWGQPAVTLRRDLALWLRDRAALTGEPMDDIANRLLTQQRILLGEDEGDQPPASTTTPAVPSQTGEAPARPP